MRKISEEQITIILNLVYQTNIPVSQFDALKKLLVELPEIKEVKKENDNNN